MIYIWLIVLTLIVIYLLYVAGQLIDTVHELQKVSIEKLEKISDDLEEAANKMEEINKKSK